MKSATTRVTPDCRSDRAKRAPASPKPTESESHRKAGFASLRPLVQSATAGYTLTELLIVLAVLVAIAALALPAMQTPLDKSRLRNAGQLVRKGLNKARATAIREGAPLEFRFEQGGRRWKVERRGPSRVNLPLTAEETEAAATEELPEDERALLQQQTFPVRFGQLPDGVIFALPLHAEEELSERDDAAAEQLPFEETESSEDLTTNWSQPIMFRPSGRTQDREFALHSAGGFAITVSLRGLTSAVSVGDPQRVIRSVEDLLIEEVTP